MDESYTLFWLTGKREVIDKRGDVAESMTLAGYSQGAIPALDFWAEGNNNGYVWDGEKREWNPK